MQIKIEIAHNAESRMLVNRIAYGIVLMLELAGKLAVIISSNNMSYDSSKPADAVIYLKNARAKRK